MSFHDILTTGDIHIVYNYSYANDATREAATGFVAADIGKVSIQTNDNTLWLLIATTPTWVPISGAFLGQLDGYAQTIDEHYRQHSEAIDHLRVAADGYANVDGIVADGYIAFFLRDTQSHNIAGDNDLFYDRENSRLGLGTTTPLGELHIVGAHPNLLVQAGTNANATIRVTEDASYKGGFIQYQGGSSPELVTIGRHATSDTIVGNDGGVVNIRIDESRISIGTGGTTGLGDATVTINSTDANLAFLETNPGGISGTDGLGKIYVGTDQRFYYVSGSGNRKQIVFGTDIDGYGQNWIDASQQLQGLRDAADGYGITQQENKTAQQQINQSILQALDGYDLNITEHYNQQQQINQTIIQNLDGYAQNWSDASQQLQDLRDVLDADAYVDSVTFNENKEAQGEINDLILEALDGYAAPPGGVSEITFQENKNAQQQINQSIIQALDGYGGVSETTFQENKNAQQQINQSIIQALDGYSGGTSPVTAIGDAPDGYAGDFTGGTTNGHGLISRAAGDGYGIIAKATTGYALFAESDVSSPTTSPFRIVPQIGLPSRAEAGDVCITTTNVPTHAGSRKLVVYNGKNWDRYRAVSFINDETPTLSATGDFGVRFDILANSLKVGNIIEIETGMSLTSYTSGTIRYEGYWNGFATGLLLWQSNTQTPASNWLFSVTHRIVILSLGASGTASKLGAIVYGASSTVGIATVNGGPIDINTTIDNYIVPSVFIGTTLTARVDSFIVSVY